VLDSLWGRLLDAVSTKLAPAIIDQWIRPCRLLAVEGDHLKIGAPNTFSRDWLIQHHLSAIQRAAQDIVGGQPRVTIVVDEAASQPAAADAPPPMPAR
jgi:chromosomal replication initiator protein